MGNYESTFLPLLLPSAFQKLNGSHRQHSGRQDLLPQAMSRFLLQRRQIRTSLEPETTSPPVFQVVISRRCQKTKREEQMIFVADLLLLLFSPSPAQISGCLQRSGVNREKDKIVITLSKQLPPFSYNFCRTT
ncbi:hypothetical protein SLEP1_g23875 [Rubroshorea leprosula]|uniref:Uncharacterized protein n=1 Tax=Rubroshorea leprosula TaxID=152421 RepID=A0AAV5JJS4_9ROSI|nr:hypothetical protein SLEP1_g23875 [Rubroshorea leprosula]